MTVLIDKLAFYALLDEDDQNHAAGVDAWSTHTYVVIESSALVQLRLGLRAAARLHGGLLPAVSLFDIDWSTHDRAVSRWLHAASRRLSLVDTASFDAMERNGIHRTFAFDEDFTAEGFWLERDRRHRMWGKCWRRGPSDDLQPAALGSRTSIPSNG